MTEKEKSYYETLKNNPKDYVFGKLFVVENGITKPIEGKWFKLMGDGIPFIYYTDLTREQNEAGVPEPPHPLELIMSFTSERTITATPAPALGDSIFTFEQEAGIDSKLGNWIKKNEEKEKVEREERKNRLKDNSIKDFQKNNELLAGYYYSKDGYFIGKFEQSENAHIIDTDRGETLVNEANNISLEKILSKYIHKIYFSGLSNKELLTFATICKIEEADRTGIFAIANSFINFVLGGITWNYTLNNLISKKGYSSVDAYQRIPLDVKKITNGSEERNQVAAVCNAILYYGDVGGKDFSNGATHWDGFDFALRGNSHQKGNQGFHINNISLLNSYNNYYKNDNYDKLRRYSGNNNAVLAQGDNKLTTNAVLGVGAYSRGRILYKSVAQYGGTIFWAPNFEAEENIGYDWKYYYKF